MGKGIFIVGTGTDVGKTYVSALVVKKIKESGKKSGYYKSAMSGNEHGDDGCLIPGDARFVKEFAGIDQELDCMCPYVLEHAYSPHLASRIEGVTIEKKIILDGFHKALEENEYLTVEGSGGILCPIRYDEEEIWLWELIKEMGLECLLVADAGLGTINQVGLTVAFMKEKKIPIRGIILNHFHPGNILEEDNKAMCEKMTGIPVVACVEENGRELNMDFRELLKLYD